jgi:DNA-binding transcriptional regulator YiaG
MRYKSEALKVIHLDAKAMYKSGFITEAEMREYDEICLPSPKTENKSSPVYANDNSVNVEHISHVTA